MRLGVVISFALPEAKTLAAGTPGRMPLIMGTLREGDSVPLNPATAPQGSLEIINALDLSLLLGFLGTGLPYDARVDFNQDAAVTNADLVIIKGNYLCYSKPDEGPDAKCPPPA